jgi:hypothetical protein
VGGFVLDRVVDELGLVLEGGYLTLFFPATETAIVFRVKARVNRGYEVFDYGPLPIYAGTPVPTYTGTTTYVPADGVLPPMSYTDDISFPAIPGTTLENVKEKSDIWYLSEDDRDTLFHVKTFIHPRVIRVDVRVPVGVQQARFQKGRAIVGVNTVMGFSRGYVELVRIPALRYGMRFGNDTNLNLKTFVRFVYAEYAVEIPRSPELIFDVLTRRVPSYWVTMPVTQMDVLIKDALTRTYGFAEPHWGFKLYRHDERDKAVKEYSEVLKMLRG